MPRIIDETLVRIRADATGLKQRVEEEGRSAGRAFASSFTRGADSRGNVFSGFTKQLSGAHNSLKSVDADIGKVTRGALAGSGVFQHLGRSVAFASGAFLGAEGLIDVMKRSISLAGDLQKQQERTTFLFGESGKAVESFAESAGKSFGLTSEEALKFTNNIGNMLTPLGIAPAASAKLSVELTKLAANIASIRHEDPGEVLNKFMAGLRGRGAALKAYGLDISNTTLLHAALSAGIAKTEVNSDKLHVAQVKLGIAQATYNDVLKRGLDGTTTAAKAKLTLEAAEKALTAAEAGGKITLDSKQKALAAVNVLLDQGSKYTGSFQKHSGDLANQEKILHAELTNVQETIGLKLIPVVTRYLTHITDWLGKSKNMKIVTDDVNAVLTTGAHIVGDFVAVIKTVGPAVTTVVKLFGGWKQAIEFLIGIKIALWAKTALDSVSLFGIGAAKAGASASVATGEIKALGVTSELTGAQMAVAADKAVAFGGQIKMVGQESEAALGATAAGAGGGKGVAGLLGGLGKLGAIGKIAIPITIATSITSASGGGLLTSALEAAGLTFLFGGSLPAAVLAGTIVPLYLEFKDGAAYGANPTGGDASLYQQLRQIGTTAKNAARDVKATPSQARQWEQAYQSSIGDTAAPGFYSGSPGYAGPASTVTPAIGGGYVSPVRAGTATNRRDGGLDFQGKPGDYVVMIGNARFDGVQNDSRGPNSGYGKKILYTLLDGPRRNEQIFVGHAEPLLGPKDVGKNFRAGTPIAVLTSPSLGNANTIPGGGWTEVGFSNPSGGQYGSGASPAGGGTNTTVGGGHWDFAAFAGLTPMSTVPAVIPGRSNAGTRSSGTSGATLKEKYAQIIAAQTGLDPRVIQAWMAGEGHPGDLAGYFNFMNIQSATAKSLGVPITGTGPAGTAKFGQLDRGAQAAIAEINKLGLGGLYGKTPRQQIAAIAASPWASSHYGGAGGPNLVNAFAGMFGADALGGGPGDTSYTVPHTTKKPHKVTPPLIPGLDEFNVAIQKAKQAVLAGGPSPLAGIAKQMAADLSLEVALEKAEKDPGVKAKKEAALARLLTSTKADVASLKKRIVAINKESDKLQVATAGHQTLVNQVAQLYGYDDTAEYARFERMTSAALKKLLASGKATLKRVAKQVSSEKTQIDLLGGLPGDIAVETKNKLGQITSTTTVGALRASLSKMLDDVSSAISPGKKEAAAAKIASQIGSVLTAAASAVSSRQSVFQTAFTHVSDSILSAFDRETQRHLAGMQTVVDDQITALQADLATAIKGVQAAGDALTPTEKEIQGLQTAHDAAQAAQDLLDAQKGLADARATGDPAAVLAAQKALDEVVYQQKIASLQLVANAERIQRNKDTDSQINDLQKGETEKEKVLQKSLTVQEADYQDARDTDRRALATQLDEWNTHLSDKSASWSDFVSWLSGQQSKGLFGAVDIPNPVAAMSAAGVAQGSAFAIGFADSLQAAYAAYNGLVSLVAGGVPGTWTPPTPTGPAAVAGPLSPTQYAGGPGTTDSIPQLASGGNILRDGLAYVHRGETVMPTLSAGDLAASTLSRNQMSGLILGELRKLNRSAEAGQVVIVQVDGTANEAARKARL